MLGLCWLAIPAMAAEGPRLDDERFRERMRDLGTDQEAAERLRRARQMVAQHLLSSQQLKEVASRLADDNARYEFATNAYPRTVDPENFYEVYDAFTTFSKVMRLHDALHPAQHPPAPAPSAPAIITEEEFLELLKAIRKESFDKDRLQVARQIFTSSRKPFLSSQVKRMADCFDFDPGKLELALLAYEFTQDREKYFLVNDSFFFPNSKESLQRFIESRPQPGRSLLLTPRALPWSTNRSIYTNRPFSTNR